MMGSKCLRVAAGLVLAAGCYALHLRDARAQAQPIEPAYRIEILPSASGQTVLCQEDANHNHVTEEAIGYDANGVPVCDAMALVSSGASISSACPLSVVSHRAVINSRQKGTLSYLGQWAVGASASWPTAPGSFTPSGMAIIAPPGCPEVRATSRGYRSL